MAEIYLCTITPNKRNKNSVISLDTDGVFPHDNGFLTDQAYNKAIKEVAEYMGVRVIDFTKCWTYYNCVSQGYVTGGEDLIHPTQKGHDKMAEQAYRELCK